MLGVPFVFCFVICTIVGGCGERRTGNGGVEGLRGDATVGSIGHPSTERRVDDPQGCLQGERPLGKTLAYGTILFFCAGGGGGRGVCCTEPRWKERERPLGWFIFFHVVLD